MKLTASLFFANYPAEFRGPGVHHNYEDSDSGYEVDADNKGKSFGVGGYRGRIIFLGDGTEVLTDSDDTEMFDNADEDKDLESQVSKNSGGTDTTTTSTTTTEGESKEAESKTESADDKSKDEAAKGGEETAAAQSKETKQDGKETN